MQAEDMAIRLILDGNPVALAAHRLGLESRAHPRPYRLHPDDVALVARQVAVELSLAERAAATVRAAHNGSQRFTGTAHGDRAAAGRTNDPYPVRTHEELSEIRNQGGCAV